MCIRDRVYGPMTIRQYRADDTFINSMLRINQSLTDEIRLVLLTTLKVIGNTNGFENIATVWKMIIDKKLNNTEQVQEFIKLYFPDMDTSQNKSFEER